MKTRRDDIGPGPELERLAQKIGPNQGHFKRMRLMDDWSGAQPAQQRNHGPKPSIAPNAPTGKPRRGWRATEALGLAAMGAAGVSAIIAGVLYAVFRKPAHETTPTSEPSPARRADAVPAKKKT